MVGAMVTMNQDLSLPDIACLYDLSYLACVKGNRIMMHRWLGQVWQAEEIWGRRVDLKDSHQTGLQGHVYTECEVTSGVHDT